MIRVVPQYVNLYRGEVGWLSRVLKANSSLLALAVLSIGLVGLAWYGAKRVQRLESLANAISGDYDSRRAMLAQIGAKYEARPDYAVLRAKVERLRQLTTRQEVVLGRTDSFGPTKRSGFSAQLRAVSSAKVDGVWLTHLELRAESDKTLLSGVAMSPDLVPRYLAALGRQQGAGISRLQSLTLDDKVADQRASAVGAIAFNLQQSADDSTVSP